MPVDDLVAIVHADDSQPRRVADLDVGDIGHRDRSRLVGLQHDVADVVERVDEADAANVEGLLADAQIVAAGVGVGVRDRADQGRERNLVVGQLLRIDIDVVFLGQSAETGNVDHAGNGLELLLEDPVLDLLLLDQIVIGTLDRVAIDFADRIFRRDSGA